MAREGEFAMRKFVASVALGIAGVALAAAPAAAHFCQNVSKPYGAGAVQFDKYKETPGGNEVLAGAWGDIGLFFDIEECVGQETHVRVFLHPAAERGGDKGIQLLSEDCRAALEDFFDEE